MPLSSPTMAHFVIEFRFAIVFFFFFFLLLSTIRNRTLDCSCVTLKHRGILCGPISEGYESRTIPNDLKDDPESRRNQQVYSASPVKTVDKNNDSGELLVLFRRPSVRSHCECKARTCLILNFPACFFFFFFFLVQFDAVRRNVRDLAVCNI